jgi:NAD(P)-dependent dehydrogenase (short-subunit alcohol dehydrogenase family)
VTERCVTHLPVQVRQGGNELRAAGLEYDHGGAAGTDSARWPDVRAAASGRPRSRPRPMSALRPLVFITGASSGIGQALAARYARAGWRLALVARRGGRAARPGPPRRAGPDDAAPSTSADVQPTSTASSPPAGLHRRAGPARRGDRQRRHQRGHGHRRRADLDVMRDTWPPTTSAWRPPSIPSWRRCASAAAGTLVGMASVAAIRGLPGHGAYCASKAAVVAYCESLRGECRPFGVRVVTLLPGYIATPLTARNPYPCRS